jgi:hypothetical protein
MPTDQEAGLSGNARDYRSPDPAWAWAPYQPSRDCPWELPAVGHLFRRAAFGGCWQDLQQGLRDGPQRTLDRLLGPQRDSAAFQREYDQYEASISASESVAGLQAWWLRRLLMTPYPLLEKMTLFWHGQFAVSNLKIRSSASMSRHIQSLRNHALGSYEALLRAILCDPAVLTALGADANRKSRPNQQFAEQLLQWLGLDPLKCSRQEVDGVARAMTGWFVRRGELQFVDREHDAGSKTIFGAVGNFRAEDLVPLLLKQPSVPRAVVRRLYRQFVSEIDLPTDSLLQPLVSSFAKDYDVGKLVERVLRSNLFFSRAAYRRRIKSPVEFAVGIIRALRGLVATAELSQDLATLGQSLCEPPTSHGWEGGPSWLNQATVVRRDNLALSLLGDGGPYAGSLDLAAVAHQQKCDNLASAQQWLLALFLQNDLRPAVRDQLLAGSSSEDTGGHDLAVQMRQFAYKVIVQTEFQLD